jgi:hypothetical protein
MFTLSATALELSYQKLKDGANSQINIPSDSVSLVIFLKICYVEIMLYLDEEILSHCKYLTEFEITFNKIVFDLLNK